MHQLVPLLPHTSVVETQCKIVSYKTVVELPQFQMNFKCPKRTIIPLHKTISK